MRGGKRQGAGRKPGMRNKRTAALLERASSTGMLPHEFLCAVSQGQVIDGHVPTFNERMTAAQASAPFYAPRLASTDNKHSGEFGLKRDPSTITDDVLAAVATGSGDRAAEPEEGEEELPRVH